MDYNNMNRRASRSAYNYDNDRNTSGRRIDNGKRREANADFQDFRRKPQSRNSAQINRPAANQPQRSGQSRPAAQNRPMGQSRPDARNGQRPTARNVGPTRSHSAQMARDVNGRSPQYAAQVRKGGQQGKAPVKNPSSTPRRPQNAPAAKKAPQPRKPQQRDWVYPEGYTPPRRNPAQNGRPANAGRGNPQRRPTSERRPQKKAGINWNRVGVVIGAVLIRFFVCFAVVALIFGLVYRNKFFSVIEPEFEVITYSFVTVTGEGDEEEKSVYELEVGAASAYDREELMVNFSEISKWIGCAQVGDVYSMRFVFGGENGHENIVFHNASQNAFVNGAPVVMRSQARFDDGDIWVPASFVTDYITGVEINASKDSVVLTQSEDVITLDLRPSEPMAPAEQPEEE